MRQKSSWRSHLVLIRLKVDSLTQIVLGAAVGETIAGKKLGNRAMLWGGIGGTIPDLDIIANGFLTPLQALVTHRGFSHSILFACIGAFVFGWLIHAMYKSPYHRHIAFVSWFALPAGVLALLSGKLEKGISLIKSVEQQEVKTEWQEKRRQYCNEVLENALDPNQFKVWVEDKIRLSRSMIKLTEKPVNLGIL